MHKRFNVNEIENTFKLLNTVFVFIFLRHNCRVFRELKKIAKCLNLRMLYARTLSPIQFTNSNNCVHVKQVILITSINVNSFNSTACLAIFLDDANYGRLR